MTKNKIKSTKHRKPDAVFREKNGIIFVDVILSNKIKKEMEEIICSK